MAPFFLKSAHHGLCPLSGAMHSEHDLQERQRRTNHSESFPLWGHNPWHQGPEARWMPYAPLPRSGRPLREYRKAPVPIPIPIPAAPSGAPRSSIPISDPSRSAAARPPKPSAAKPLSILRTLGAKAPSNLRTLTPAREALIKSLFAFILEFLCNARNGLTRIASYLRKPMTKQCIKILIKENSMN